MATNDGLSAFGDKGLSFAFGWDSNEIHRKVYLADPKNQMITLLNTLFGTTAAPAPMPCFYPFTSFYAYSTDIQLNAGDKGSQGDKNTEDGGTFNNLLASWPAQIRGGVVVDITYRPMEISSQGGNSYFPVTEENWDYSAQVLSLIGNNFGQSPNNLTWSDGVPITNLTAISKIIPKIEFVQRKIFVTDLPSEPQISLIGQVNDALLQVGRQDANDFCQWPPGTVLLTGLPSLRRWRFDGAFVAELGIKLAINTYKDVIETGGSPQYVTWNRLYRHTKGYWDKVQVGPSNASIYTPGDLAQVTGAH